MINIINSEAELISIFFNNEHILLYGTGFISDKMLNFLRDYNLSNPEAISFLISPGEINHGNFRGYKIQYSDNETIDKNMPVIVSVSKELTPEITKCLLGFNYNNIYILHPNFYKIFFKKIVKNFRAYRRSTLLRFQVHLAEHCNLNCKYCDHFSPLAKPGFLNISEYESDLAHLSKLFDSTVEFIFLLGGEPLLNPEVNKIMAITRQYFKYGYIGIITNGILLNQMSDKFWQTCHDYEISLYITRYPINLDYESIFKKANKAKVVITPPISASKTMDRQPLKPMSNHVPFSDIDDKFSSCQYAGGQCPTLNHGRMYSCVFPAYAHHLIDYFNLKDVQVSERDSVDIKKITKPEELLEFLAYPTPFCRFCNVANITRNHPWELSNRDISEWIDL